MRRPALAKVGSIQLAELEAISVFAGRDFLPFPFMLNKANSYVYDHERTAFISSVMERYRHGDLQVFTKWAKTYESADIRVECRAIYSSENAATQRIVAHRQGQLGFFSAQRPGDVIDVFELSPYELGAAVADAATLTEPGKHAEIALAANVVPRARAIESASREFAAGEDHTPAVSERVVGRPLPKVASYEALAASATVQSHWRPARKWGLDHHKNAVVWLTTKGDGDYLCTSGSDRARPMTRDALCRAIDSLIAEDVAVLRKFRRS